MFNIMKDKFLKLYFLTLKTNNSNPDTPGSVNGKFLSMLLTQ